MGASLVYEVTMPYGQTPVASWECLGCDAGEDERNRAPGSAADDMRDVAIEHARRTGHDAQFRRGTCELICALATGKGA